MYDINLEFVIILCAKAPSLVTHDEKENFVIESARSVTNFSVITTESSLLNTFLVVQVINPNSEFHFNGNETLIPNNDDHLYWF